MAPATSEIPCPGCGTASESTGSSGTGWRCPRCSRGYSIRRCSACQAVSLVSAQQQPGQPWHSGNGTGWGWCPAASRRATIWCSAENNGFRVRADPATATLAELGDHIVRRGLVLAPRVIPDTQPVLIVTTNEIPGYRITGVQGDVFGLIVRARNVFSNLGAQLRTVAGGEVSGYTKLLTDSRNQARERMWREARSRGANAVVAMRFDCNEFGDIMSEVAAYGTAVIVEPVIDFTQSTMGSETRGR